jgi:hypothetical protein
MLKANPIDDLRQAVSVYAVKMSAQDLSPLQLFA